LSAQSTSANCSFVGLGFVICNLKHADASLVVIDDLYDHSPHGAGDMLPSRFVGN
jgi:hypothetical protein